MQVLLLLLWLSLSPLSSPILTLLSVFLSPHKIPQDALFHFFWQTFRICFLLIRIRNVTIILYSIIICIHLPQLHLFKAHFHLKWGSDCMAGPADGFLSPSLLLAWVFGETPAPGHVHMVHLILELLLNEFVKH